MNELLEIWDLIVKSNTFNFVLLVVIFYFIFKKINISKILTQLQQDIINSIENVKKNKIEADKKLAKAKDSVKTLDNDIEIHLKQADETAKLITQTIFQNSDKQIELIKNNVEKAISSEEKSLSVMLKDKAASAAVAIAQTHIINMLKNRPDLHDKYIEESIQELDRIQL